MTHTRSDTLKAFLAAGDHKAAAAAANRGAFSSTGLAVSEQGQSRTSVQRPDDAWYFQIGNSGAAHTPKAPSSSDTLKAFLAAGDHKAAAAAANRGSFRSTGLAVSEQGQPRTSAQRTDDAWYFQIGNSGAAHTPKAP